MQTVIEPLYAAYKILLKGRQHREPLELSVTERKIIFNDKGEVDSILPRVSIEAHRLVEEFMIQANVAAAEELQAKGWPCMFRVHEEPSFEKIENLREFLESLDFSFAKGQVIRPKIFNNFLNKVKGTPQEEVINTIILRTQMKAIYTGENIGHFGLSLANYAHFTSPIRRYADTLVHRSLIGALKLGDDGLSQKDQDHFKDTAEHISTTERTAMLAERESTDRYVAAFMQHNVGKDFEGRIAGVSRAGLFVTLEESGGD
jgi:ribonuclease R